MYRVLTDLDRVPTHNLPILVPSTRGCKQGTADTHLARFDVIGSKLSSKAWHLAIQKIASLNLSYVLQHAGERFAATCIIDTFPSKGH